LGIGAPVVVVQCKETGSGAEFLGRGGAFSTAPDRAFGPRGFLVLYLNRALRLIRMERISQGGITGTVADPRIIFRKALALRSVSLILAHNHPSGSLYPSVSDRELTSKICQAAEFLDMTVNDHLIVSRDGYYSFADEGLL